MAKGNSYDWKDKSLERCWSW